MPRYEFVALADCMIQKASWGISIGLKRGKHCTSDHDLREISRHVKMIGEVPEPTPSPAEVEPEDDNEFSPDAMSTDGKPGDQYDGLTRKQLIDIGRSRSMTGVHHMNIAQLLAALTDYDRLNEGAIG